jgi:hypothetical protein
MDEPAHESQRRSNVFPVAGKPPLGWDGGGISHSQTLLDMSGFV